MLVATEETEVEVGALEVGESTTVEAVQALKALEAEETGESTTVEVAMLVATVETEVEVGALEVGESTTVEAVQALKAVEAEETAQPQFQNHRTTARINESPPAGATTPSRASLERTDAESCRFPWTLLPPTDPLYDIGSTCCTARSCRSRRH